MKSFIPPGKTIGIFGGGQLGRMFTIAAKQMGYYVHTYSDEELCPASEISDFHTFAEYEDLDKVKAFAKQTDVVTFEFENIPVAAAREAAAQTIVAPEPEVLFIAQNRQREKTFLSKSGFPVTPFVVPMLENRVDEILTRFPQGVVLKTANSGYDGKGQAICRTTKELSQGWNGLGEGQKIVEKLINIEAELSFIVARQRSGDKIVYGPFGNVHKNHIFNSSVFPFNLPEALLKQGKEIVLDLAEQLKLVGILCVEFFLTKEGELLINEIAPRTHNSGHLTIEAFNISQFELHLRAITGMPLGNGLFFKPACMVNLLGDVWAEKEPKWQELSKYP